MNKMYLVLGDWSDDGHGKFEKVLVESNKSVGEIQDAYKASCSLTGVSFNHNDDFTKRKRDYRESEKYQIATEYEQGLELSEEGKAALLEHGLDFDNLIEDSTPKAAFIVLWTEFVKLSLPDLIINKIPEENSIPVINGYWNANLNVQFGYGLFS